LLIGLLLVAFAARLAVRLTSGEASYEAGSYGFYRAIAMNMVEGHGLCTAPGRGCALRGPIYPIFLAPFVAADAVYPWAVVAQAALGSMLVLIAFGLARALFHVSAGLAAAALAALSPYAVIHDTAQQETVVVNVLMALSLYLLIVSSRSAQRGPLAVLAGLACGLAVLTTTRVLFLAAAAAVWQCLESGDGWRVRLGRAALFTVPMIVLVGGWMVRNWTVVGAPVLTTEAGTSLWVANNEWTFAYFPSQSIDLSAKASIAGLSEARQADLAKVAGDAVAEDRLAGRWGWDYITTHLRETVAGGVRKIWVVLSARYTPARGGLTDLAYRVLFLAVHALAAVGLWRSRRHGVEHWLSYGVLAAFLATTAMFWSHTSHKSIIDVLLFVYAAPLVSAVLPSQRIAPIPSV